MKRTILILDNDDSVRSSLKKLLEIEGYDVLPARNTAEAFEWLGSTDINLLVMDVNLDEEDGWAAFQQIADTHGFIPTVIVTAEFGQLDQAISCGVEALVEKPMDVSLFLALIRRLLTANECGRLNRVIGDRRYCRYLNRGSNAFCRDLERRYSTPLDMSWFERLDLLPST